MWQSGGAKRELLENRKLNDDIDTEYLASLAANYSFLFDFMQPPNCTDPGAMQDFPFDIALLVTMIDIGGAAAVLLSIKIFLVRRPAAE